MATRKVVAIHPEYLDFLKQFGGPSYVADALVELMYTGELDAGQMTPAPPVDASCMKLTVAVTNKHYKELVAVYGASSPMVSIRRALYYFVDNELYTAYPERFTFNPQASVDKTKQITLANLLRRHNNAGRT